MTESDKFEIAFFEELTGCFIVPDGLYQDSFLASCGDVYRIFDSEYWRERWIASIRIAETFIILNHDGSNFCWDLDDIEWPDKFREIFDGILAKHRRIMEKRKAGVAQRQSS